MYNNFCILIKYYNEIFYSLNYMLSLLRTFNVSDNCILLINRNCFSVSKYLKSRHLNKNYIFFKWISFKSTETIKNITFIKIKTNSFFSLMSILDICLKRGNQLITVPSMSFVAFHFMLDLLSCMNDKDKQHVFGNFIK